MVITARRYENTLGVVVLDLEDHVNGLRCSEFAVQGRRDQARRLARERARFTIDEPTHRQRVAIQPYAHQPADVLKPRRN